MRKSSVFLSLIASCAALTGCDGSKSADLSAPAPVYSQDKVTSGGLDFKFNPKVDILFVVDNSTSMKEEQAKLLQAAELFVESFGENNLIDYHVGVMTVYDSRRCGQLDVKSGKILECYPEGKLQPLKSTDVSADLSKSPPYVMRAEGAKEILKASLNVGTLDMANGGPRFEELFSPILTALSPAMNKVNGGFFREDSKIVIIMVTDEDDSSAKISVDSFLESLDQASLLERMDLHAVLATDGCSRNSFADAPDRITSVVQNVGGKIFKICDESFGSHLATIGSDIRKQLLQQQVVLPSIPESGTLKLFYGSQEIPLGQGWTYDPRSNIISINENISVVFDAQAKFSVQYIRIDDRAIAKGRATPR